MPVSRQAELRGGEVEGLVPADALPTMRAAPHRVGDPLGIVLAVYEEAIDLAAEGAPRERVLGISAEPDDAIAVDLCHHAAGIEAIERAGGFHDSAHQENSGEVRASGAGHSSQNLAFGEFSCWQRGHCMPGPPSEPGRERSDRCGELSFQSLEGQGPVRKPAQDSLVRQGDRFGPGPICRSPTRFGNSSRISRGSEIARGSRG